MTAFPEAKEDTDHLDEIVGILMQGGIESNENGPVEVPSQCGVPGDVATHLKAPLDELGRDIHKDTFPLLFQRHSP